MNKLNDNGNDRQIMVEELVVVVVMCGGQQPNPNQMSGQWNNPQGGKMRMVKVVVGWILMYKFLFILLMSFFFYTRTL